MRVLEGEQWMVRIFIGESDRWQGRALSDALVERLRKEGFAGATVLRGLAGFGARSVVHTSHLGASLIGPFRGTSNALTVGL